MEKQSKSSSVTLKADLSKPPSRALWLVKWLLLIPHWIALALLWVAYTIVCIIAFFAILFTARFPRKLFNFNVGVLRWTWRVGFYGYWILGTDEYPPFSLKTVEDYPADLEVEYPERFSRGLIFVKWLLAVPHYLCLTPLMGWGIRQYTDNSRAPVIGLIFILMVIIAFVLLFTKKYNENIFKLNTGIVRWLFRVLAYIGFMTDQYPPFKLWE
ncbi:MAG: DUF4389 domain-containing protein [bacterium]